jgi:hypothetical protein
MQVRQGEACQELAKPVPRSTPRPPSPHEPLPPDLEHFVAETGQRRAVAREPVIRRMPLELLAECRVLLANRVVSMKPAPLRNRPDRPREPAGRRLPLQNPVPLPRSRPKVREPQEVERPALSADARSPWACNGTNRVLSGGLSGRIGRIASANVHHRRASSSSVNPITKSSA